MRRIPGAADPAVTQLAASIAQLEQNLAALESCIQTDGSSLTLKVPLQIKIEAGAKVEFKCNGTLSFRAAMMRLNPNPQAGGGAGPALAAALATTPVARKIG